MLIKAVNVISGPLAALFNRSLNENTFPKSWKVAHVTPIFKKGEPELCGNYRPVSLLSCIGKVMERCIQTHVYDYLKRNSLLTPCQSGFIPGDSTIFQLLAIYHDFCRALDNKLTSQAIFFDISKAFDKVWHRGLLHKLDCIGIRGTLLNWFSDYLFDRQQAVIIKGKKSTYKSISAGVPQGSVLGPLLFLIYINDIVCDIDSTVKLFADDTSMYLSLDNTEQRTMLLNSDISKITEWSRKWKVTFNPSKTKLMTISNRRQINTLPLYFDDQILTETPMHKHLGVILQNNCKWDNHIDSVVAKCRLLIACLRSFKYTFSRKTLTTLYKSFILPHLDYADVIWNNCTDRLAMSLETLHLDAIRTIIGAVRGTSHNKLYTESGFLTLKERRERHKLILYFKIINGLAPAYIERYLPPTVAATNPYHRRNPLERQIPKCNNTLFEESFFISTTYLWNSLPESVKLTDSLSNFKRRLGQNDPIVPPFYFEIGRKAEIIHTKLRLEISDLQDDLVKRHLANDSSCRCGHTRENAYHYFFECPFYLLIRTNTISKLDHNDYTLNCVLHGNFNKTLAENVDIFQLVNEYISQSNRFV